jgi:hypothetical protein
MDALRSAALRLHAVGPADRNWILGRLDRKTRKRLSGLLRELNRAGFDPSAAGAIDLESAAEPQPDAAAPPPSLLPSELVARLEREDAQAVARALGGEPGWVVAAVLAAHPWTWRSAVLKCFNSKVSGALTRPGPAGLSASLVRALVASLARRMDEASSPSKFDEVMEELGSLALGERSALWKKLKRWIR